MEQYISKSALTAEIERRKQKLLDHIICERDKEFVCRTAHQLNRIIDFIDTLEVKEVDWEKEVNDYGYHYDYVSIADRKELVDFAKHFFELGMAVNNKAQKGE
jgi:hypothetical protein